MAAVVVVVVVTKRDRREAWMDRCRWLQKKLVSGIQEEKKEDKARRA